MQKTKPGRKPANATDSQSLRQTAKIAESVSKRNLLRTLSAADSAAPGRCARRRKGIVRGQSLVGTIAEWRSGALTPQQAIAEARRAATAMNQLLTEGKA